MSEYSKMRDLAEWGENEIDKVSALQDFVLDRELDDEAKEILVNLTRLKQMIEEFNGECLEAMKEF